MTLIAAWNVNSIKARLGALLGWLRQAAPDIVLLQETKTISGDFPHLEIESLGYRTAQVGQKSYNGVAILAREPIVVEREALPGDASDQAARYIEAKVGDLRVASVYVPNGQSVGSDKFAYKMGFLDRLERHAHSLLKGEEPFIIAGDYNIAPEPIDVHDPAAWAGQVLFSLHERRCFRRLINGGLTDSLRALHPTLPHAYSWWDYRAGAWSRDDGLRIDHLLLSPQAADRLEEAGIDRGPRGLEQASDHTPVWCRLRP